MNRSKIILAALALGMMGAITLTLGHARDRQQLGSPGVKTRPMATGKNLEILLPGTLPGYTSEIATNPETQLLKLPPDTSFRVRNYKAGDGSWVEVSVVLMGSDRSSIHKPEICMTGQGWILDQKASGMENIHLQKPIAYDLPVNKLIFSKPFPDADGRTQTVRGIYVFWFVDASHYTASPFKWMLWWMPRDLFLNDVLERWAYISYFTACEPGQEQAAFERMKKFIAASVPEYQLVPAKP